ncbi:ABC transporter substrate-binding protein [Oceanidesulfovibrio marinus]|uniref:ABC transporter substrate-binding protein n=1 Tax=Oceanidesulfovibrio marinus TaxID=370038 RepID=A0A6P1ZHV4_9BACT|nr:ABC transporter substrate-binding protein [Oceanidesulfovibrio marinus]TVM34604.1 ABC transporter substrate-binding protein [Oceanidesulfovibrio marinus]
MLFRIVRCCIILAVLLVLFAGRESRAAGFDQAPSLAALVRSGDLPPAHERLPTTPLLVRAIQRPGRYGGVWRMGMRGNRDHALIIRTMGYENLVRWDPLWARVIPNIAASVTPNEEYTRYRFRLRPGMRWSDGEPFTARDILFWYEDVLMNPDLTKSPPEWLTAGGRPVSVEVVDEFCLDFVFDKPYGLFLRRLAHPLGAEPTSYPMHYLSQFMPRYNPDVEALCKKEGVADWTALFAKKFGAVGNYDDPSRFRNPDLPTLHPWVQDTGYTEKSTELTAHRNPYYWKVDALGRQLPYIDELHFAITDQTGLERMAAAGEIDMQNRHIAEEGNRRLLEKHMADGGYHFFRTLPSRSSTYTVCLNMTHRDPVLRKIFDELDFRRALSHGIDRAALIAMQQQPEILQPYQVAPRPESPFYRERMATQYLEYDPALAGSLLDDLGLARNPETSIRMLPDGSPLAFEVLCQTPYLPLLKPIVQGWRELGLDVTVRVVSRSEEYALKDTNRHDALFVGAEGGLDVLLENQFYLPSNIEAVYGVAWVLWQTDHDNPMAMRPPPRVMEQLNLYDDLKSTGSPAEQTRIMNAILDIAEEQFYAIGLFLREHGYGLVRNNFHNVPELMPYGWSYPTPAPTNPSQYYTIPPVQN